MTHANKNQHLPAYFKTIDSLGNFLNIKIDLIDPDNKEEIKDLAQTMARAFSTTEPTTTAAGLTESDFFQEIHMYLQFAKKDRLSIVVKNNDNNKIIGGIIGRDFFNDENEDPFIELPNKNKYKPVFDLLDQSKEQFCKIIQKEQGKLKKGLAYRGFFIGFLSKYITLNNKDGVNITLYSFRAFEEYLKEIGYKYFYGEATNPGSQKLFHSSGWTINEIIVKYKDHPLFKKINFREKAIAGIGNSLSGAIRRLENKDFTPLPKTLINKYNKENNYQLGFPHNLNFNFSDLANYLDYHINNAGDPNNHSNYQIHSRNEEKSVLNFMAQVYKIRPKDMWGYLTSGATEANEMALYLARCKFPNAVIYASADSHYSVRVCSDKLKIPLCEINTQNNGEIDYKHFEKEIKKSTKPAIIVLNIGTTMKGAIDNAERIISILEKNSHKDFYIHCDAALHGGFLPFLDNAPKFDFSLPIDSLCVSLHKFLGMPFPSASFTVRKSLLNNIPKNLVRTGYNGKRNNTLSCSRNGLAAILAYNTIIQKNGQKGLKEMSEYCIDLAKYAENKLIEIGYQYVLRNKYSNIITFKTPSRKICKKWQLSVDKEIAHIITMPHVTENMIDEFILDMTKDTKNEQVSEKKQPQKLSNYLNNL